MIHTTEDKYSGATKQKIFLTAAQLFAEKGFKGVSMREISEKSDVTKPTIYYYFGSKEGIYRDLVITGVSRLFLYLEEVKDQKIPVKQKLIIMTKRMFNFALNNPEYIKFFLTLVGSTPADELSILESCKKEAEEKGKILVAMIQEGMETGEFGASAKPEIAAQIIGGAIHHFIWHQLASKKKILTDNLAEDIIEMLFKGLNE